MIANAVFVIPFAVFGVLGVACSLCGIFEDDE